jgi:hypothetical protein
VEAERKAVGYKMERLLVCGGQGGEENVRAKEAEIRPQGMVNWLKAMKGSHVDRLAGRRVEKGERVWSVRGVGVGTVARGGR